jgi:hypothetical protein
VLVLTDIGTVLDLTDFSLKIDLKSVAPAVAASRVSPDVFDGVMQVSGSVKIMRRDLIPFADAIAELPITLEFTIRTPVGFPNFQTIQNHHSAIHLSGSSKKRLEARWPAACSPIRGPNTLALISPSHSPAHRHLKPAALAPAPRLVRKKKRARSLHTVDVKGHSLLFYLLAVKFVDLRNQLVRVDLVERHRLRQQLLLQPC